MTEYEKQTREFRQLQEKMKSASHFVQYMTLEAGKVADDGKFTATLLTLGEFNEIGNMFLQDAFDDFISEAPTVPMYFQHSGTNYIGVWQSYRKEEKLFIGEGRLLVEVSQEAAEKAAMIKGGYLNRVSVGGEAEYEDIMWVDRVDPKSGKMTYGLVYKKARLFEASLVLRPADTSAVIHQSVGESLRGYFPERGKEITVSDILTHQIAAPPDPPTDQPDPTTDHNQIHQDALPPIDLSRFTQDKDKSEEMPKADVESLLAPPSILAG